jgi:hypothetical protein
MNKEKIFQVVEDVVDLITFKRVAAVLGTVAAAALAAIAWKKKKK